MSLRAKDLDGEVSEVGGWGGGIMNGGAWLSIDGRPVDVHYRELGEVEHWCSEAREERFRKEFLLFYATAIPAYVVMAELAVNIVLSLRGRQNRYLAQPTARDSSTPSSRCSAPSIFP